MADNEDMPLEERYALCERARHVEGGDGEWKAHVAVLDRLMESRQIAEASGWTSCAIERDGDAGRFQLFGIPPSSTLRTEVPDWPERSAAEPESRS